MEWQPIETAPKEFREGGYSTRVLLYCGRVVGTIRTGHWFERNDVMDGNVVCVYEGWWLDGFDHPFNQPPFSPTHWMPLPDEPQRS